jgi:hypothetical protein
MEKLAGTYVTARYPEPADDGANTAAEGVME